MKFKFLFYFLLLSFIGYSQNDIYILRDSSQVVTLENIETQNFKLSKNQISDGSNDFTYWFKIPKKTTEKNYIFRLIKKKYDILSVYQNGKKIDKLQNQRHNSFLFNRDFPVYIKFKPKFQCNFKIEVLPIEESIFKEKRQIILNSMYYGFALVIIMYNLFYFYLLKDDSFLYYALFLFFIAFSFSIQDGMLIFFDFSSKVNTILSLLCFICIGFFSSKFANSYLLLDSNYPKHKNYTYAIGFLIILFALIFYFTNIFIFYKLLSFLVFSLLITYWIFGLLLYKTNIFIKIFVFAYAIILFTAIDFFVLRILGVSTGFVNEINIKVGSILEMIIISFAVLYRVRELKKQNEQMHSEILNYSKTDTNSNNAIDNLSIRESEIFNLIIKGNSNKQIANELNISINTVKFHIKNIYDKLDISSRKEVFKIKKANA